MTSREFYQLVDRALEPECRRLGFSRRRGAVSLWFVSLPTGTFFYEIAYGVKSPYVPPIGGRFSVHCDLTHSSDPKARGPQSAVSYMEYLTSGDLEAMRELRDRVIHKIVGQRSREEFDRLMLEMHTPLLRMEIGQQFNRHQVFKLPYLDADDVTAWAEFLASRLQPTLAGVRESPVFPMRVEDSRPGAAPNGGPATRVGNSGAAEGPPSVG